MLEGLQQPHAPSRRTARIAPKGDQGKSTFTLGSDRRNANYPLAYPNQCYYYPQPRRQMADVSDDRVNRQILAQAPQGSSTVRTSERRSDSRGVCAWPAKLTA
jgi:hypothetical protein